MYAAVKRMWLLAQVARDDSPAPTIPVASISAKSALEPVITLPEQPTSTAVYQEPSVADADPNKSAVPFPSRFAIPMNGNEEAEQVAAAATEHPPADELPKSPVAVDTTPIEAAPPLGRFSSRFSAAPVAEPALPAPAQETETPQPEAMASLAADSVAAIKSRFSTTPAPAPKATEEKSNANNPMPIMSSAGSLLGSLASRLASNMTSSQSAEPETTESLAPTVTLPSQPTAAPQPTAVAEAPQPETGSQASLRIVGEKPSEPQPETPPEAKLIKPAPIVEAQPLPSRPVVTAAPRDMPTTTRPTWQAGETKIEPVATPVATTPQPQPRLNRAFASTAASASIPTTNYVPAQNASSTKVVTTDDAMPHRLPPTIEVSSDTDKGVTKEADPAWVQQMIQSGSFIPGQRFVPTQTPQPLPIGQQSAQPLANPAQPPATAITPTQTQPTTYVVQPGDDLATIARRTLGDAARWGELFRLNRNVIGDYPDQMKPGMTLRLPQ